MTQIADVLKAALGYAERGWRVLPLWAPDPDRSTGCTCWNSACESPGKHPRTLNDVKDASPDPDQIRKWWQMWPDANVGIATGNGLIVLDVDPRHGGDLSLMELEEQFGEIVMLTARTGGGGDHLYLSGALPARNAFQPGLDLKSDGGLVVPPPSLHASERLYTWLDPGEGVRIIPSWLPAIASPPRSLKPRASSHHPVDAGTAKRRRYVECAIRNECLDLSITPEGNRNNRLNEAAFSLARFVTTDEARSDKLIECLTLAASHAGLSKWEIERTIQSAFGARELVL